FEIVRDANGVPETYPGSGVVLDSNNQPLLHQLGEPKFYIGGEQAYHTSVDPVQRLERFQRLTGLDMVGGQIDFAGLDVFDISLGSGDDSLVIADIRSIGQTTIHAGSGSDSIRIDRDGVATSGSVDIQGESGDGDRVEVFTRHEAGAGTTTWNVSGDNSGNVSTDQLAELLRFDSVESFVGADASDDRFVFTDGARVSTLLDGRAGQDTIDFSASTSAVTINRAQAKLGTATFAGIEHVIGGSASDTLIGENLPTIWNVEALNRGAIESIGGDPRMTFESFENLVGGDDADRFVIASGAAVSGSIHGGSHVDDLLDYSDWSLRVVVDLASGTATATGGIAEIEHVTGGSGPDQLMGNSLANRLLGMGGDDLLDGRAGDDLLVGGFGDDRLLGGAGRDLMFGGVMVGVLTNYDDPFDYRLPPEYYETESKYSSNPANFGLLPSATDPFDFYQNNPNRYRPRLITPLVTAGQSVFGDINDGADTLQGGTGDDVLFGGGEADVIYGDDLQESAGDGADYIDAGGGNDVAVYGGAGEDVILGGHGNDRIDGGTGIDQLYGNEGDDSLVAGRGNPDTGNPAIFVQAGQRLFGGDGRDTLFGWSEGDTSEATRIGDQLFGGAGGDQIYGSLRRDVITGGGGSDDVRGDGKDNPPGINITIDGGADLIWGDGGNDNLLGGGGNDTIFGGTGTDLIDGQGGDDRQYGGSGIDIFRLSTDTTPIQNDTIDGHFGNTTGGDTPDDNATDILQIDGTGGDDTILIGSKSNQASVLYNGTAIPVRMLDAQGTPLIEQFRISGLAGNDMIGFYTEQIVAAGFAAPTLPSGFGTIDLETLGSRSRDFVGMFDGNSGNDTLLGSAGRDRMDGGIGSDLMFGFGGSDRMWGDGLDGRSTDRDVMYAGQGDDDLVGGQGVNQLYAWSFDPTPGLFGVLVDEDGKLVNDSLNTVARIKGVTFSDSDDVKLFGFDLDATGTSTQSLLLDGTSAGLSISYMLFRDGVEVMRGESSGSSTTIDLNGQAAGRYQLSVQPTSSNDEQIFQTFSFDLVSSLAPNLTKVLDLADLSLETTGLNRLLGNLRNDELYGGTTLDFMYGNGGNDTLYRSNGTTFESLDGGLAGDEWKEYAKESDQVWYIGGSNANDQISVDFVTEPGLLTDHHLITRLTENNGNFSFSAQVRLDFSAADGEGNPVWDANETLLGLDQLLADPNGAQETLSNLRPSEADLINNLLPPEGDFLVVLIDALDGNDTITVGPTVQKTVWVDAGAGDDVVKIRSGNAILVDKTERSVGVTGLKSRNDIPAQAFNLVAPIRTSLMGAPVSAAFDRTEFVDGNLVFTDLSIDSPTDVDWYTFKLVSDPAAGAKIELASGSPIDSLGLKIYKINETPGATGDPLDPDNMTLVQPGVATGNRSEVSLADVKAGTTYYLEVTSPNIVPTVYDLRFNLDGLTESEIEAIESPAEVSLSLRKDIVRRDVILGGDGNDILQGGGGEDWIFGNAGNDVLTGGDDRQASDLLFGGPGDDTFQIIPDALPLLGNQPNTNFDPATQTYIPTYSDQFIGGDGTDRVLFLGGDLDRRGNPVPDYVSMRYNTGQHRYEFTGLVWDIGTQEYRFDDVNEDGNQDAGEDFEQEYFFFQTRDVETFTIDTRAGDDVVRLDSGFQFLPLTGNPLVPDQTNAGLYEEWGLELGDFEQGADLPLTLFGGDGNDSLFGSPTIDLISGGSGNDLIVGGLGSDKIDGDGGDDVIFGSTLGVRTNAPYPHVPPQAVGGLPELAFIDLAIPFTANETQTRTGIDLNKTVSVTVPVNVPANPIAYYSFDLGDGSNGVNGSPNLIPTGVTFDAGGISGGAAAFAGQTSVLAIGTVGIDAGADWTAAAWFKGMVDSANHNTLFHATDHPVIVQADSNNLGMWDNTTGRTGNDRFRDSGYDLSPAESVNGWQHLVAVGTGNETQFYLNGTLVGVSDTKAAGLFERIGNISSGTQQFAALIDEVYIYDRPLNASEIRDLYDSATVSQREVRYLDGIRDQAFGIESAADERLERFVPIGDFNADGKEDFMIVGADHSYVMFGPARLNSLVRVNDVADIVIDHVEIGTPATQFGDVNGDGYSDLSFVRSELGQTDAIIVFGGGNAWPRIWDREFLSSATDSNLAKLLQFDSTDLTPGNVSISIVNSDNDDYGDLLVSSPSNRGTIEEVSDISVSSQWGQNVFDFRRAIAAGDKVYLSVNVNTSSTEHLFLVSENPQKEITLPTPTVPAVSSGTSQTHQVMSAAVGKLYFQQIINGKGSIWSLDSEDNPVRETADKNFVFGRAFTLRTADGSERVYLASDTAGLWEFNPDNSALTQITGSFGNSFYVTSTGNTIVSSEGSMTKIFDPSLASEVFSLSVSDFQTPSTSPSYSPDFISNGVIVNGE
ncbi:MAG: hypothetical protein KDB00_09945, partial [Planctomycetales bacterium]|nr:hypothetical protein [Planctomycetales bacterium]